jgi:CheY-like chemotaxis protein
MVVPAELPRASEPLERRTLLVVEDEVLVRGMVGDFLREQGFVVIEAADATEALAVFASGVAIDLVFSDVHMPGRMDGVTLAALLRASFRVPVLLTTGDPSRISPSILEVAAIMEKPYALEDLARCIEALIDAHQAGRN